MKFTEIEVTAHHEAGHTVAAFRWGSIPDYLSICPGPGRLGYTQQWQRPVVLGRHEVIRRVRFSLAGLAAEELLTGKPSYGAAANPGDVADESDEWEWLNGPGLFDDDVGAALEAMLVAYPKSRCVPERLKREFRVTCAFLRAHWKHVEAVARGLLENETLYREHLIRAVYDVGPIDFSRWEQRCRAFFLSPRVCVPHRSSGEGMCAVTMAITTTTGTSGANT